MVGLLLLLAAPAFEVEVSGGAALGSPPDPAQGEMAPAVQLRAGVDLLDHLTVSAAFLGVPGNGSPYSPCFQCSATSTFRALSGFGILRVHTDAAVQAFAEAGIGVGHLISFSNSSYFENPPLAGRAGPAFLLGGGGRWFVGGGVALGLEAAWTMWTRVTRPPFEYGVTPEPATDDLRIHAVLLLFSVGWSSAR